MARDDFGRSKGFGYIQFSNAEDGKKAMEQLNNFELANRPIKVSLFISDKSFETSSSAVAAANAAGLVVAGAANVVSSVHSISNLDNDELDRTGVPLGPSGKLALMAKLAEGTGLKLPQQTIDALAAPIGAGGVNGGGPLLQTPTLSNLVIANVAASQCILLRNMFDLAE